LLKNTATTGGKSKEVALPRGYDVAFYCLLGDKTCHGPKETSFLSIEGRAKQIQRKSTEKPVRTYIKNVANAKVCEKWRGPFPGKTKKKKGETKQGKGYRRQKTPKN